MASDKKESGEFQVTFTPHSKERQTNSRKRTAIFAVGAVIILLIILAVCLGVILTKDDNSTASTSKQLPRPVILISADGFRPVYLTLNITPNIMKLANGGVRANFMLSQFPTKTFPNHYTAVTGLYPESHGIVFNSFYAPELRRRFSIRFSSYPPFWGGEPIWVTAKKSGLKTASYFWVGSEIKGKLPTYFRKYNQSVSFSDRVKQVLEWLKLPQDKRPSFITLYFHEPDYAGHGYGPESPQVRKQVSLVDKSIGQLMSGLEEMNISDSVNVILTSDHGMASVNCNDTIYLDKYGLNASDLYISNEGSVLTFNTKRGIDRTNVFNKIECRNDSFQSFYKTMLPKRMHFSKSRRIDDIVVLPHPGELVSVNSSRESRYCVRGSHGNDNILPDMWPIFVARGPSFEKGKVVEHFSNLEIYNLLATLLKIKPAENNGTMGSLNKLLVPEARSNISKSQSDGSIYRSDIGKFPSTQDFYSRSKNICACCKVSPENVTKINMIFNITAEEVKYYEEQHLPWGLPEGGVRRAGCILTQPYFIIGFSLYLRIPLWTANKMNGTLLSKNKKTEDCYRSDIRLTNHQTALCANFYNTGYDPGQLVPNRDLNFDMIAMFSTSTFANIVPMYPVFKKGIWARLESMVRDWSVKYNVIHVITGTIFDVDGDGIKDNEIASKRRISELPENPAIPTHLYKIVARCESNTTSEYEIEECSGDIRVISFILPHTNEHCKFHSYEKLILQNVAPVRDIELLTGINFFFKLPAQLQVELKTFIPVKLWP